MNILQNQTAFAVGLDVGGTKTEALIVDQNKNIPGRAKRPTDPSQIMHSIVTSRLTAMVGTKGEAWHLLTAGAFVTMVIPLIIFWPYSGILYVVYWPGR